MEENVTLTLVKRCRMSNSSELFSYKLYTLSMLNFQVADTHTHTHTRTRTHHHTHLLRLNHNYYKKLFLKKECLGQKNSVRNCCNLNIMYKMSSLLKVIVMKVNRPIFQVNGRFTVVLCSKTPHKSPIPKFYITQRFANK